MTPYEALAMATRTVIHDPKTYVKIANVEPKVPEFSPSFDRFDKAVLITGVAGLSFATAGPTMATIGAGIVFGTVGLTKLAVRLGELHQKRMTAKWEQVKARLAEEERRHEAEKNRPPLLKDDALWEKQWRESPVAFWLCPDLWNADGTINWPAVDAGPKPLPEPYKMPDPGKIEDTHRKAARQINKMALSMGVTSGQFVEGVRRMGYVVHNDMLEIEYIDGRRKLIDHTYLERLTPSQRVALVNGSYASRRERVKDIVRFARLKHAEDNRDGRFSDLWIAAVGPRTLHITNPEAPHRTIQVHDGMDPEDAYTVAEWIGYYEESDDEFWD